MIGGEYITKLVELTWTGAPVSTSDVAPDDDIRVPVAQAKTISVQLSVSGSANVDVLAYGSMDGVNWDTVPYYEKNGLVAGTVTLNVSPGPKYLRLRINNNDASNAANVTARVLVRE